jgi:uncharacterized membrane protein
MVASPAQPEPQTPHQSSPSNRSMLTQRTSLEMFQGPLPPPSVLEHYDRIVPGAAQRILAMAEQQATHRQALERRVSRTGTITSVLGQLFAFVLTLRAFEFAVQMLRGGHSAEAVVTTIATIGALVGVFIVGKRQATEERRTRVASESPSTTKS